MFSLRKYRSIRLTSLRQLVLDGEHLKPNVLSESESYESECVQIAQRLQMVISLARFVIADERTV